MNFSSLHDVVVGEAKVGQVNDTSVRHSWRIYYAVGEGEQGPMNRGIQKNMPMNGLFRIDEGGVADCFLEGRKPRSCQC